MHFSQGEVLTHTSHMIMASERMKCKCLSLSISLLKAPPIEGYGVKARHQRHGGTR